MSTVEGKNSELSFKIGDRVAVQWSDGRDWPLARCLGTVKSWVHYTFGGYCYSVLLDQGNLGEVWVSSLRRVSPVEELSLCHDTAEVM